jgi:hypothetical protein
MKCKTSHCSIIKAVFGKTRDSRIKSPPPPHILMIYPQQTFSYSPKSNPRRKREDLKTRGTLKEMLTKELFALHENKFKKFSQQFYDQAKKGMASQGYYFLSILKEMFNFKCSFLKIYSVMELICITLYMEKRTIL